MSAKYFEMRDDVEAAGRWWLGPPRDASGHDVSPWIFFKGESIHLSCPLTIPLRQSGRVLDFTFGYFDMPMVNRRTLHLLEEFLPDKIQVFSVRVEKLEEEFWAVNFLEVRKCLNEAEAEFIKWKEGDIRPDKIGEYRQITKLRINSSLAEGEHAFRLWGWSLSIIVSEAVQKAFLESKISGVYFRDVT